MRHLLGLGLLLISSAASAMSVDWTGVYRFEWVQVDKPSLATPSERKAYGLNYLGLSPKIIVSDGVTVTGKFDVLANQDSYYNNTQMGQLWGQSFISPGSPNVTATTKESTALNVQQLYLTVQQEYGSLLVGRAPYHFGLGLAWSGGNGDFDHWAHNTDLVAYKFIVGNLSFMPMVARVSVPGPAQANAVQDETFQFMYETPESTAAIGAVMSRRKSARPPAPGNDIDPIAVAGPGATATDAYSMQTNSFFLSRSWDSFRFRMEAAFMNGEYGVKNASGENVRNNSYGIAVEMEFPRPESKWDYSLKLGVASGDDPKTADIEGFFFERNYDVAMLLFNHRLGRGDFLRTNLIKDTTVHGLSNSLDDEAISNAFYVAPKIGYAWSDRWEIRNTLIYAQVMNAPSANSVDFKKDLGLEWDIEAVYKPRSNIRWVNGLGLLFPGAAFKDGASDLENGFTYGFTTKAAITF